MRKLSFFFFILFVCVIYVNAENGLDVNINILEKTIAIDDPISFQINTFRIGEKREDIYFEYFIETDDKTSFVKSESIAVEKIGSFIRTIELPPSIQEGKNTLFVKATEAGREYYARESFDIIKSRDYIELPQRYVNYFLILLTLIILIFIAFIIEDYTLIYKLIRSYEKISEKEMRW